MNNNRTHDLIHQQLGLENIVAYNRDLSCSRCYPPEYPLSIEFENFWTWISFNYWAHTFTVYTQQFFEEIYYTDPAELNTAVRSLLFSIRFADLFHTDYTLLRQNFINEYSVTSGFQPNPEDYQISETSTSPELDPNRPFIQEFEESSNTSDSEESLHLEQLFQQPL